jgi:hypothetical protein
MIFYVSKHDYWYINGGMIFRKTFAVYTVLWSPYVTFMALGSGFMRFLLKNIPDFVSGVHHRGQQIYCITSENMQVGFSSPRTCRDRILGHEFDTDSILLHAIHSLFYWRILQKTMLYSGFKTPYKIPLKHKKTRDYS